MNRSKIVSEIATALAALGLVLGVTTVVHFAGVTVIGGDVDTASARPVAAVVAHTADVTPYRLGRGPGSYGNGLGVLVAGR